MGWRQLFFGVSLPLEGPWDSMFGTLAQLVDAHVQHPYFATVANVLDLYKDWAREQLALYPGGPRYHFEEFAPNEQRSSRRSRAHRSEALRNHFLGRCDGWINDLAADRASIAQSWMDGASCWA